MTKKTLIILISSVVGVVVLVAVVVVLVLVFKSSPEEKDIAKELEREEVEVTKVKIKKEEVIIDYNQLLDLEEEEAELFATWAYILGVAANEAPGAEMIIVNCEFEDGEKVRIIAKAEVVKDFLAKEISAVEFLQNIVAEPLTKGPKM